MIKVLVVGAEGQVGRAIQQAGSLQSVELIAASRQMLDVTDEAQVQAFVAAHQPDLVMNASAYTAVDKAESERELAFAINADGPGHLARACAKWDIPLIHLSTDYVFDGTKSGAYLEADVANPQSVYGASKWQGEEAIRALWSKHYIIRVSWVFGVDGANFVKTILRLASSLTELRIVADQRGCPTSATSIAALLWHLLPFARAEAHFGTYHFSNTAVTSWYDFALAIVEEAKPMTSLTVQTVTPITTLDYPTPAYRPPNSELNCAQIEQVFGLSLPMWRDELRHVLSKLLP